ncbi:MAG: hypothetical protein QF473_17505 [Planctomycetota bacterium]|jgi:hypothetical protein|nr:hypothetical protein [Planctomycetota bacterium]MDP6506356.1 hypothetical protein [Planctomycetota bacterium]
MNVNLHILILSAMWSATTDRLYGEDDLHSPEYFESFYSGLGAMYERRLDDAADSFARAISLEDGAAKFGLWARAVEGILNAAKEEAQGRNPLKAVSSASVSAKLYFITKYLDFAHHLGPSKAHGVMQALIDITEKRPWGVPANVKGMIYLYDADALSDMIPDAKTGDAKRFTLRAAWLYGEVARLGPGEMRETAAKNSANYRYQAKDYAAAIDSYLDLAIDRPYSPDRPLWHINAGKCYLMQKNYAAAEGAFVFVARDFAACKLVSKASTYIRYTRKKGGL